MLHKLKYTRVRKRSVCLYCTFKRKILHAGNFEKKIFRPNLEKKKIEIIKPPPKAPSYSISTGLRVNEFGIQMIPKEIHNNIFRNVDIECCANPSLVEKCKKTLEKHNMTIKESDYTTEVNFKMPPLEGKNLVEHFERIAQEQIQPYLDIINVLLRNIPPAPKQWLMKEGWTRYTPDGQATQVEYPLEEGLVFDVEVCVQAGKSPTLATAVSSKAWYGWVSSALVEGVAQPVTGQEYPIESLIPLESTPNDNPFRLNDHLLKPKVVIGHNVSYDRARIKEQYWLERTGTRFVDTMSLHICVSGLTSYQRAILKSGKLDEEDESWQTQSSLNGLSDVHRLYCGEQIKKATRDLFIGGQLKEIKEQFQDVMNYCCSDVEATYRVLEKLFPLFIERFPHPVTFAGMLELGTAYLPVNSNWTRYVDDCEQVFEDLQTESKLLLMKRADQACQLLHDQRYRDDIWLWDQDWEVKNLKLRKPALLKQNNQETVEVSESSDSDADLAFKFKHLFDMGTHLSAVRVLLPGYPNWYRKLCTKPDSSTDWVPGPHLISTAMRITPKLLNLTWEGYPLHYIQGLGWGFLIPFTEDLDLPKNFPLKELLNSCPVLTQKPNEALGIGLLDTVSKKVEENLSKRDYYSKVKKDKTEGLYKGSGVWCNTIVDRCCYFFKLPHKDGASYRVGNPLAKDFLNKFSENVLAGDTESAEQVLSIARMCSYWRNNKQRIMDQIVVWLNDADLPEHLRGFKYGAIVPQVVVCGTLTRRAVEPTWMTASNAMPERLGSELRSMVQAPPGYNLVGADVDSQELWIASVIGDAHHAKIHGATPFGWMTLSGNKAAGTDMHSITAKAVGISRDHAKVLNYARIYGAGQNFAEQLLKQFNPTMSNAEARSKAIKMFNLTKGKLIYHLKPNVLLESHMVLNDQAYSKWQAYEIAKLYGKRLDELFLKPKWVGGTESAMFNRLEEIAGSESPVTPFLKARLSRALEPKLIQTDRFLATKVNWVVQSGAVDFLHLMLVCMRWLMKDKVRFCLSFHDEVRYIVKSEYKYQAALAMHLTNLLVRSFCSIQLGLSDLPMSVAFFSSVEVDTVLRKDSKQDCKTPSNPHGLEKGYGIPNGESLDIYQAILKAGGQYTFWYNPDR